MELICNEVLLKLDVPWPQLPMELCSQGTLGETHTRATSSPSTSSRSPDQLRPHQNLPKTQLAPISSVHSLLESMESLRKEIWYNPSALSVQSCASLWLWGPTGISCSVLTGTRDTATKSL